MWGARYECTAGTMVCGEPGTSVSQVPWFAGSQERVYHRYHGLWGARYECTTCTMVCGEPGTGVPHVLLFVVSQERVYHMYHGLCGARYECITCTIVCGEPGTVVRARADITYSYMSNIFCSKKCIFTGLDAGKSCLSPTRIISNFPRIS